ncbi:hypothetical protein [Thermopirellula anaerolimosa]
MGNNEKISKGPEAFLKALEHLLERGQGVSAAWRAFWEMELRRQRLPAGHWLPQWKPHYDAFAKAVDAFSEAFLEVDKVYPEEREFPHFSYWGDTVSLPYELSYLRDRTAHLLGILRSAERNVWFIADLADALIGKDWGTRIEDTSARCWDDDMATLASGREKYRHWWEQQNRDRLRAALLGRTPGEEMESDGSQERRPTKRAKKRGRHALSAEQQALYQKIREAWQAYRRHTNNSWKDFAEEARGRFGELYEKLFAPRRWNVRAVKRALSWVRRSRASEKEDENDA